MESIWQKIGRFFITLLLGAGTALAATAPVADASANSEIVTDYDTQAVLIAKFGLYYVDWPEITMADNVKVLNVCIMGSSPQFLKAIGNVQTKVASRIKLNIKTVESISTTGCNIAYIPRNNTQYKEIISAIGKTPVLTISPIDGFASNSGIVEFVLSETKEGSGATPISTKVKVTYKVNLHAAETSNLKIAPELLETSEEVIR